MSKCLWVPPLCSALSGISRICQTFAEHLLWTTPGNAPRGHGAEGGAPHFRSRRENGEVREVPPRPLLFVMASRHAGSATNLLQKQCHLTERPRPTAKSKTLKSRRKATYTMWTQCKCHRISAQKPFPSLRVPKCYPAPTF